MKVSSSELLPVPLVDAPALGSAWSCFSHHCVMLAVGVFAVVRSNCNTSSGRDAWATELMKHFPVDSYGRCLNNMDYQTAAAAEYRGNPADLSLTRQIMARYKFVISHENALIRDYVSEKVFFALQVGVVPVYRGAPNIDDYVPSRSVVNSAAFASITDLAAHLHSLLLDSDAYASYLGWKARAPEPHMVRLVGISSDTMFERICARSKARRVFAQTPLASNGSIASGRGLGLGAKPRSERNHSLWYFNPAARFNVDGAWV